MTLNNIRDITYNYKEKIITFWFKEKELVDGFLKDSKDYRGTYNQWVEQYAKWTKSVKEMAA